MRDFVAAISGTAPAAEEPGFAMFDLPNGDRIEIFDAPEGEPSYMTAPVAGFLVDDVDAAKAELAAMGIELLGPGGRMPDGYAWQHFRGPDGHVYEVTAHPGHPARE